MAVAPVTDNIQVAIRIRPMIRRERESNANVWWATDKYEIWQKDQKPPTKYTFDAVFNETYDNMDIYEAMVFPVVEAAMQGFNGTIFAYGQTASGKTYTMQGNLDEPGIIPMAIDDIFNFIENTPEREFLIRTSYLEIYNENIVDLLGDPKVHLEVREDKDKKVYIQHLEENVVTTPDGVLKWLKIGQANRHLGSTNMNECSSRSHTIFRVIIESCERVNDAGVLVSHLNLVDLAGSEKGTQTGAKGLRLAEGEHMNKSLRTLSLVISQLIEHTPHVSYQDSKLTSVLQNSLGGNSKTVMICNTSPAYLYETRSTLLFATSSKKIENKPVQNEVLDDRALIRKYKAEITSLTAQLGKLKNIDQELQNQNKLREDCQRLTQYFCVSSKQQPKRRNTWPLSRSEAEVAEHKHKKAVEDTEVQKPLFEKPYLSIDVGSRTGVDVREGKIIRKDSHGYENFSDFFTDSESESDNISGLVNSWVEKEKDDSLQANNSRTYSRRKSLTPNKTPAHSIKPMDSFTPSTHENSSLFLPSTGSKDDANPASPEANQSEQDGQDLLSQSENKGRDLDQSDANNNDQSADGVQDDSSQSGPGGDRSADQSKDESNVVTFRKPNQSGQMDSVTQQSQSIVDKTSNNTTQPVSSVSSQLLEPNDRTQLQETRNNTQASLNFLGNGTGTITRADKSPPHTHTEIMMESPASALNNFRKKKKVPTATLR